MCAAFLFFFLNKRMILRSKSNYTKEGGNKMSVYESFPVANLDENQLEKVTRLEKELRKETDENIVLIAYDEKNE